LLSCGNLTGRAFFRFFALRFIPIIMRHLLLFTVFLAGLSASAQKAGKTTGATSKTDTAAAIAHYERMYAQALRYNDFQVATSAMYAILGYRPNDVGIKDTLARLYFTRGMSSQAVLVGMEVIKAQPDNLEVMEVVAASQENLGLIKESLETYEQLYQLTGNNYFQYQVASLQYRLKRLGECKANLEALLNAEGIDKEKITISYGQAGSQQVGMKAAVINMLGVLALDLGQNDMAKQLFEQAVKLEPQFVLAQANLQELNKPATDEGGKPNN
jgi:tetratricopeptide (TPR) repeat protein